MTPDQLRTRLAEARGTDSQGSPRASGPIPVQVWANGPGERYGQHSHDYDKVLVCDAGSIVFVVGSGQRVGLEEGDRLDLPAGTDHAALVGRAGVRCLEAHLPAGSLVRLADLHGWASDGAVADEAPRTAGPAGA
jgi:hypothetical protein